jgi:type I restriction enzyme M protein
VYRKVTRKINDFSPEQTKNLAAIVWLYRGEQPRFLMLVRDYFRQLREQCAAVPPALTAFDGTLIDLGQRVQSLAAALVNRPDGDIAGNEACVDAATALREAIVLYETDRANLLVEFETFAIRYGDSLPAQNGLLHSARKSFEPIAEGVVGLGKQVELLYKLAEKATALCASVAAQGTLDKLYDRRGSFRLLKRLETQRMAAVEQLRHAVYFHRQVVWLQDRFPDAVLQAVPGLVRSVNRAEIEASGWSLTPGRYVGVASADEEEGFDFEQTLRDIHTELLDLNKEAVALAATIQTNFEELLI